MEASAAVESLFPGWNRVNEGWFANISRKITCGIFRTLNNFNKEVKEVLVYP